MRSSFLWGLSTHQPFHSSRLLVLVRLRFRFLQSIVPAGCFRHSSFQCSAGLRSLLQGVSEFQESIPFGVKALLSFCWVLLGVWVLQSIVHARNLMHQPLRGSRLIYCPGVSRCVLCFLQGFESIVLLGCWI